jgi:hypothetical protein
VSPGSFGQIKIFKTYNSVVDELYLWSTRLYLHVFHFFDSSLVEPKRVGIMKAYATATTLVSKVIAADTSLNILAYSPIPILRMLFTAASVIFKVLASNYSQYVDYDSGTVFFNSAISALRRCSVEENDMAIRAADILAQLWKLDGKTQEEPNLVIQSRLGASLMFDCLWRWKECIKAYVNANAMANSNTVGGSCLNTAVDVYTNPRRYIAKESEHRYGPNSASDTTQSGLDGLQLGII